MCSASPPHIVPCPRLWERCCRGQAHSRAAAGRPLGSCSLSVPTPRARGFWGPLGHRARRPRPPAVVSHIRTHGAARTVLSTPTTSGAPSPHPRAPAGGGLEPQSGRQGLEPGRSCLSRPRFLQLQGGAEKRVSTLGCVRLALTGTRGRDRKVVFTRIPAQPVSAHGGPNYRAGLTHSVGTTPGASAPRALAWPGVPRPRAEDRECPKQERTVGAPPSPGCPVRTAGAVLDSEASLGTRVRGPPRPLCGTGKPGGDRQQPGRTCQRFTPPRSR